MDIRYIIIPLIFLFGNNDCLNGQGIKSVNDLPLQLSGSKGSNEVLVIYLSGDGGWNDFNRQMVHEFEKHGYGVVALNTRKYFWNEKSPEGFAQDIDQLSKFYLNAWKKSSLIIVGYSFGADVGIFLPNRVSVELQKKIVKIALISPSVSTDFVVRFSDLIGTSENVNRKYKVGPEIEKALLPIICVFGKEEVLMLQSILKKNINLTICELPGDHRYNNNFELLLKMIRM